jgi:HlyD family secretion protein
MKRRTLLFSAGALLACVLAAAGAARHRPATAARYVTTAAVRETLQATVSASGTLRPVDQVDVGSAVSGRILHLRVDFNSRVRAGQVLAEIDPSSFQARVDQFAAGAARARATLQQAEWDLKRQRELATKELVAASDLEKTVTVRNQAKADLQSVEAQLASARVDLANTVIRAPIDGVVLSRQVDEGQTVAASLQAPTLFEIARDLTDMQLETSVDEADIGRVNTGQSVRFTVDAYPGTTFVGTVHQVRLQSTTTSGVVTYTVIIRTRNEALRLRPGMTADVLVQVAKSDRALVVPNAALRLTAADFGGALAAVPRAAAGDSLVFVIRGGRPEAVAVTTGLSDGVATAITSGALREGDAVVTEVTDAASTTAAAASAASKPASPLGSFGPPAGLGKRRS